MWEWAYIITIHAMYIGGAAVAGGLLVYQEWGLFWAPLALSLIGRILMLQRKNALERQLEEPDEDLD